MWKEEVIRRGLEDASLEKVVFNFVRTRLIIHISLQLLSLVLGFLGPVRSFLRTL